MKPDASPSTALIASPINFAQRSAAEGRREATTHPLTTEPPVTAVTATPCKTRHTAHLPHHHGGGESMPKNSPSRCAPSLAGDSVALPPCNSVRLSLCNSTPSPLPPTPQSEGLGGGREQHPPPPVALPSPLPVRPSSGSSGRRLKCTGKLTHPLPPQSLFEAEMTTPTPSPLREAKVLINNNQTSSVQIQ
jgi:hypothetical protein